MGICSMQYVIFLIVTLAIYYILPNKIRFIQKYILLAASIVFYISFKWIAVIFVGITSIAAFLCALLFRNNKAFNKFLVFIFILTDVGSLFLLKYQSFFNIGNISETFSDYLIIPLGISFYSLSVLGYVIDVYRGKYKAERNIFRFLLFVLFFPHIMQGPIARYDMLKQQFENVHIFDWNRFCYGLQLMLWGYIKKMVVADSAAVFVNNVYEYGIVEGGTQLFVAGLLYTIEIYADFSGCVDIVTGTAELFGIELMKNFEQPYFSHTLNEFWRRWHISLSSWFRDYLYIPLGGNRKGTVRRFINMLIVFIVSGIWHGVGYSFIAWGLIHGMYQIAESVFYHSVIKKKPGEVSEKLRWVQQFVTFNVVNIAWIFFRVDSVKSAIKIIIRIITKPTPAILVNGHLFDYGIAPISMIILLIFILLLFVVDYYNKKGVVIRELISTQPIVIRWTIWLIGISVVIIFGAYGSGYNASDFIYMNF